MDGRLMAYADPVARKDLSDISETGTLVLTMADYAQFIASETATFEAECQHIVGFFLDGFETRES
jgi:hypothetical protein